jgi:hypothetical protein
LTPKTAVACPSHSSPGKSPLYGRGREERALAREIRATNQRPSPLAVGAALAKAVEQRRWMGFERLHYSTRSVLQDPGLMI